MRAAPRPPSPQRCSAVLVMVEALGSAAIPLRGTPAAALTTTARGGTGTSWQRRTGRQHRLWPRVTSPATLPAHIELTLDTPQPHPSLRTRHSPAPELEAREDGRTQQARTGERTVFLSDRMSPGSGLALIDSAPSRRRTVLRLCLRQPAHIRVTRRRSVPPSPSFRIPKEEQQRPRPDSGDLTPVAPYQLRSSEVDQASSASTPCSTASSLLEHRRHRHRPDDATLLSPAGRRRVYRRDDSKLFEVAISPYINI